MTFIEENSGKIAAVLCVASAFPLVGTVYAMEANTSVSDSKNVVATTSNSDITSTDYIINDDNESTLSLVDNAKEVTKTANVSAVHDDVVSEVKYVPAQEVNQKEDVSEEATPVVEEQSSVSQDVPAENPITEPGDSVANVNEAEASEGTETSNTSNIQTNISNTINSESAVVPQPSQEPAAIPNDSVEPKQDVNQVEQPDISVDNQNTSENTNNTNVAPAPAPEQVEQKPTTGPVANDLNARIAEEAKKLVGVTNGLQCTQVVQMALANAGVSDAYQLWPDEYCNMYGYYTDNPQPGNLIYYNNGGRGVDHIAIYIGNGQAVHGNFWIDGTSYTVIDSVNVGTGSPQYIQVVR